MVMIVVAVLAAWLALGGASALVLSRTLRVRDRQEPRPRGAGGSSSPGPGGVRAVLPALPVLRAR